MPTIADRTDARTDASLLDPEDLWSVLAAVLALHRAADPREFPDVVGSVCERLLPADHVDMHDVRAAWADRSAHDGEPPEAGASRGAAVLPVRMSPDDHRMALTATASRRSFWIVLERYAEPFEPRDRFVAESLQAHLGPAFDHARLRAGEWEVTEAIRSLTVREQEVLALVADGRTNRDIGLALFIEPRTVEKHVEHIRTKLGARSRTEAAAKWARGVGVPTAV